MEMSQIIDGNGSYCRCKCVRLWMKITQIKDGNDQIKDGNDQIKDGNESD